MSHRTLMPAAVLALLAGTATAQFVAESPAGPVQAASAPASRDVTNIVQVEDGRRAELRIEGGRVVMARLDGREWPADRIRSTDDQVLLLGTDGQPVQRFMVRVAPPATERLAVTRPLPPATPLPPGQPAVRITQSPPPVMLGITFSEPGEALRAHLNLGDKPALVVDGVIDTLPAAKAGLRKHDIITSMNGSDGASGEILREIMVNAKPDDILKLTIRRGAETVQTEVKLAAFEASAMNVRTMPPVPPIPGVPRVPGMHEDDGGMHLDIDLRFDAENLSQVEQRVRERVLELQRMAEDFRSDASRQMLELREGRLFVRPADELNKRAEEIRRLYDRNAPEIQSRLEQRLAEMESRMEAAERSLEARMDRLAALMERMAERLEKNAERKD